tara:strand:- start:343 stop:723 length:381 start_codon:yes stop_codon:yes gene_type:complete
MKKGQRGFLLFEVMLSIVIVTVSALFIMRSYSSSKMSIQRSTEILRTALLLENKMFDYEIEGAIRDEEQDGDFEENDNYSWEMEAESLDEGFGEPKFNIVRLSVFKEKNRKNTEYSLWTYLKYKKF